MAYIRGIPMRTLVSWTQYDLMIRSNVDPPVEVVSGGISGVGEDGVGNWRSSNARTNRGTSSGRLERGEVKGGHVTNGCSGNVAQTM